MKKNLLHFLPLLYLAVSCGSPAGKNDARVLTVTIPPLAWFVEAIAGNDFEISIMLPPGADHHIWEPLPVQVNSLARSEALIMNGQLSFEQAWIKRFREINPQMRVLDLSRNIDLIRENDSGSADTDNVTERHSHHGPDPHFWMSPVSAQIIARDIKEFLSALNPQSADRYQSNLDSVITVIAGLDSLVRRAVRHVSSEAFMIYHPALGYLARDYGLKQISFEDDGKNPSPARMKELIDLSRDLKINIIFIQAEYDLRNAQSLSSSTGAELVVINPMNRNWPAAVMEVLQGMENKQMFE